MKLSFSTKGWRNRPWEEFCRTAKDLRFGGVELHNIHNELFNSKDSAFLPHTLTATLHRLYEMKLEIPCIDTICDQIGRAHV